MQAVKIIQKVTHNGISIPLDKVKDFEDKDVEIIILPTKPVQSANGSAEFLKFAGKLSESDADEMLSRIKECRTIDKETWE